MDRFLKEREQKMKNWTSKYFIGLIVFSVLLYLGYLLLGFEKVVITGIAVLLAIEVANFK